MRKERRRGEIVNEDTKKAAEDDYMLGMSYKDIAAKYDVTINTVKSWKQRYEWSRNKPHEKHAHKSAKSVHTNHEKVCAQKEAQKEDAEDSCNMAAGLTEKQELYCLYYVKYRNQVKAYQRAYNCDYKEACSKASRLMKKAEIRQYVEQLLGDIHRDIMIDINDLLRQQIDIVMADYSDYVDIVNGVAVARKDIDGTAVKKITNGRMGANVELYDKQKAIEFIAKHMPENSRESRDTQTLADLILNSRPNRNLEDYEDEEADDEHTGTVQ